MKVIRSDDQDKNFGLGRPFYFNNWYNRIALMGTLLSTIILLIFRQVTGTGTGSIMTDGVSYAAGFFFAYLIGLEADPEPGVGQSDRRFSYLRRGSIFWREQQRCSGAALGLIYLPYV